MFLRELLCICVVLHFGPGFYKWVDCALVRKPKNVAVLSGENVTLNCASRVSKGNVAWSTVDSGNYIYINKNVVPSVSSYITVSDEDDGNCSLNINASLIAAKRYICIERDSGEEASAELIVLQNHMKCNSQVNDGSVHVNCSIVYAGNWDPVVECAQMNEDKMFIGLQGSQTRKSDINVVTNTWNFSSKNHVYDIICSIESKHTDRPRETTAAYCPLCGFRESDKFCNTELDKEYSVQWNPTFAGEEIHRSCPGYPTGSCSRKCLLNSDDGIAYWSETTYIVCFDKGSRDLIKTYDTSLSIISIIGCSISVVALILTVLVYALTWKQSGSAHTTFLLSLCVALIIAYIIIMVMAGSGKDDSKDGCKAIAVLLHYFLLAAFFVILAEGVELMLYEVFVINVRRLIGTITLVASAWVLPLIIAVVSLVSAKGEGYGNSFTCWLSVDSGLIWAAYSPVLCITSANFVIRNFVRMWMLREERFHDKSEKKRDEIRGSLWNLSVTCPILGLGCLFGFLSVVFSSVAFQILFVIINSLLGLSIFIFHALYHNKVMKEKLSKYIWRSQKPNPIELAPTIDLAKKTDKPDIESCPTID